MPSFSEKIANMSAIMANQSGKFPPISNSESDKIEAYYKKSWFSRFVSRIFDKSIPNLIVRDNFNKLSTTITSFIKEEQKISDSQGQALVQFEGFSWKKLKEMNSFEDYYEVSNNEVMMDYGMDIYAATDTSLLIKHSKLLMDQVKISHDRMSNFLGSNLKQEFKKNQPNNEEFSAFQHQQNTHKESFKGKISDFLNKSMFSTKRLLKLSAFQKTNKQNSIEKSIVETYYDVLGIERSSTQGEIKKAYYRKALIWHPDKNKDPIAESKFKRINEANECLQDPDRRKIYDQQLQPFFNSSKHSEHAPANAQSYGT